MNQSTIKKKLDQMNFNYNSTIETVVTTYNIDGSVNPAPMGIIRNYEEHIIIKPYISSNTYNNIIRNKIACVNIINDPMTFLKTTFKKENLGTISCIPDQLTLLESEGSINIKAYKIENSNENRSTIINKIEKILLKKRYSNGFSRGKNNAVEAIIHASHIEYKIKQSKEDVNSDLRDFKYNIQIIKKVSAKESPEMKVAEILELLIKKWRSKV